MRRETKRVFYQFLALLVPVLTLLSPSWLAIGGVGPRWAELWLLPWAIEEGPISGLLAGFCLGAMLDGINLDGSTQIPALMILGYLWGQLGTKRRYTSRIFELGLLSWSGSIFSGILIWLQEIFLVKDGIYFLFNAWALKTIFATSILNALLAPLLCNAILQFFYRGRT